MTPSTPQQVTMTIEDLVREFNKRGAEIRRLHEDRALLLAACKIALPYLKTDDAREIVREAIARTRGEK
jgi:hypothetical protein